MIKNQPIQLGSSFSTLFLVLILIFTTKMFQSTPFETVFFKAQALYLIFTILFTFVFFANSFLKLMTLNAFMYYILFLMFLIPFYSALSSMVSFDQPFYYGYLSQRGWFLAGSGLIVYYFLVTNKVTFKKLEKVFFTLGLLTLILYTLLILYIDPSTLADDANYALFTESRGIRLKFNTIFITFLTINSFVKYMKNGSKKYLVIFFLALLYIFFLNQGRIYIINMLVTLLIFFLFDLARKKQAGSFLLWILVFLFITLFLQIFTPTFLQNKSKLFLALLDVFHQGGSEDMSTYARIWQIKTVFDYFNNNFIAIWFGVGTLSHQWNEGFQSVFGYFHPSDIGVLGVFFLYGVIGFMIVYITPIFLTLKLLKSTPLPYADSFLISIKFLIIFLMINSVATGNFGLGDGGFYLLICILLAFKRNKMKGSIEADKKIQSSFNSLLLYR